MKTLSTNLARLLFILLCSALLAPFIASGGAPLAYFPFDEATGTVAHDAVGTNNLQYPTSGPGPDWRPTGGIINGAYSFDASGQGSTSNMMTRDIQPANTYYTTNFPVTVMCWIYPNQSSAWQREFICYVNTNTGGFFGIGFFGGTYILDLRTRQNQILDYTNSVAINDGKWHHVTGVWTSTTNRTLYVDGIAIINTNAASGQNTECDFVGGTSGTVGPNRLGVGGYTRLAKTDAYNGLMDDAAFYNEAITPQKIALINFLGQFEAVPLTNSAVDALVAVFANQTGIVSVNGHNYTYGTNVTGTGTGIIGTTGGSVGGLNDYVVLDTNGNGIIFQATLLPVQSFSANPTSLYLSQSSTLTWSVVNNPTSVTISPGVGAVGASGTTGVTPTTNTTYTLISANSAGSVTNSIAISVNPLPIISSFSENIPSCYPGDAVTLSWSTLINVDAMQILPDVGAVPINGTIVVNPTTSTTYSLIASNVSGFTTNFVTINVLPAPAPPQIVINWGFDLPSSTNSTGPVPNAVSTNFPGIFQKTNSLDYPQFTSGGEVGNSIYEYYNPSNDVNSSVRATGTVVTNFPFTLMSWYKTTSLGMAAVADVTPAPTGAAATNDGSYYTVGAFLNGYPWMKAVYDPQFHTFNASSVVGSQYIADGNYHHLVAVFNSEFHRQLYVDGQLSVDDVGPDIAFSPVGKFSVGGMDQTDNTNAVFNNPCFGEIDESALYSGELSANDIADLYSAISNFKITTYQAEALRSAFQPGASGFATVNNILFERVVGGWVGSPAGTAGGDLTPDTNAYIVMDNSGSGMEATTTVPPTILSQPLAQTVYAGGSASFSVQSVSSIPQNYQWFQGTNQLSGQTAATLLLSSIQPSQAGDYTVQISNSLGATNSVAATLNIVQLTLGQAQILPNGQFQLQINGVANNSGRILVSSNLAPGSWTLLTNVTIGAGGTVTFADPTTPIPSARYYEFVTP